MAHVLVVGAGPAGATLALLLARRGLQVTLLERHADFAREFRGEVLMPSGLDVIRQVGLWDELQSVPQVTLPAIELYVAGRRRARADFSRAAVGELQPLWISQPGMLEMLVAKAAEGPGFRLERGVAVRALLEKDGRITGVRALSPDGHEQEHRADLVVGADGRTSVVRKRGGLEVDSDPTPMDVVWCKLPRPDFSRRAPALRAYFGTGHLLLAAPVYDDKLQLAWIIRKGSFGELRERGMPECLEEMAGFVSPDLAGHIREHRHASVEPFLLWTVSDRVREWTRPGLLVIGDAAHTMSPVGAQGINIALRDAVVAANHLVPVLEAGAGPDAIDAAARRVQEERVPEVRAIQRLQAGPPRVLFSNAWWARQVLRIAPLAMRLDIARGRRGNLFGRFGFGVTDVRLRV